MHLELSLQSGLLSSSLCYVTSASDAAFCQLTCYKLQGTALQFLVHIGADASLLHIHLCHLKEITCLAYQTVLALVRCVLCVGHVTCLFWSSYDVGCEFRWTHMFTVLQIAGCSCSLSIRHSCCNLKRSYHLILPC